MAKRNQKAKQAPRKEDSPDKPLEQPVGSPVRETKTIVDESTPKRNNSSPMSSSSSKGTNEPEVPFINVSTKSKQHSDTSTATKTSLINDSAKPKQYSDVIVNMP